MSHFKKIRLIRDFYEQTQNLDYFTLNSNSNEQKSENLKDNPCEKQKKKQPYEQYRNNFNVRALNFFRNVPETNVSEPSSDAQEQNVDKPSSTLSLKRISKFKPPPGNALEGSERDFQILASTFCWKHIKADNLAVKYCRIYSLATADKILKQLENEVQYLKPEDSKVQVYGKWHQIPRKHAAYGEEGVTYRFSNATLPAKSWDTCSTILELKKVAELASGETYNFVLINRYKDGTDYMGEHKDNESDLVVESAISSFSFGQARDFLFKYDKNKLKDRHQTSIPSVKQNLETGSLLIMEHPTNIYWYHSLPVRKNAFGVRVNLTFRNIVKK